MPTVKGCNLPDDLLEGMRSEAWFNLLSSFEPAVAPHREWFDKVRVMALDCIDNGHPDDAEADPPQGSGVPA